MKKWMKSDKKLKTFKNWNWIQAETSGNGNQMQEKNLKFLTFLVIFSLKLSTSCYEWNLSRKFPIKKLTLWFCRFKTTWNKFVNCSVDGNKIFLAVQWMCSMQYRQIEFVLLNPQSEFVIWNLHLMMINLPPNPRSYLFSITVLGCLRAMRSSIQRCGADNAGANRCYRTTHWSLFTADNEMHLSLW